jgi:hypothetical protein
MAKTVKVKLKARQWVHGGPRNAGEIVELPETAPNLETGDQEPFAELFGEIVPDEIPLSPEPVSGRTFGGLHDQDPAEDDE